MATRAVSTNITRPSLTNHGTISKSAPLGSTFARCAHKLINLAIQSSPTAATPHAPEFHSRGARSPTYRPTAYAQPNGPYRGGAVDEVVDEASVMEVADSSAYNSFARQPIGLPRERYASVGKWKLFSRRGAITLTTEPISLESFKIMLIDTAGLPVDAAALAWPCDVNLCLLKNGKIFADVYSQVVDVDAVKTSVLEAWTLKLNGALTQYGPSDFFGRITLYGPLKSWGDANLASLEVLYGLMVRGVSTFTAAVTFQARVDLPAATYVNGSLLEPPVNITITGCTASDSWLPGLRLHPSVAHALSLFAR
ncbi:hypothetical protein T492DRAFT_860785 [Pavlovales sp. CCMP2436]|nr:hypothetical protein T492DRAFT_860785 [Pavlovales sp. CCMP2436]